MAIEIINLMPKIYDQDGQRLHDFSRLIAEKELEIGRYLTEQEIILLKYEYKKE